MNKFSILKKSAIAAALVAGVSVAGTATAGSIGQATLTLNNFVFKNNATNTVLDNSAFTFIAFTDSTNLNPSLNGVFNPFSTSITSGTLGQNVRCVPSSCAGMNSATPFANVPPPATVNGALAASNLTGAPVANLANPNGPSPSTPATAQTAALAEVVSNGNANTTSNLQLQSTFQFQLANNTTVLIDFDTIVHVLASMNQGGLGDQATAADNWSIRITGGGLTFNWTPDGQAGGITGGTEVMDQCNMQAVAGVFVVPGTDNGGGDCSGHEAATVALLGGTTYTLTLNHGSVATASLVPEPESVALMGLGLLGLAIVRRRAKRQN